MNKRPLVAAVILLVVAGAAAWQLRVAERLGFGDDGDAPLTLYGNVDIRQVELGFRVPGRIERMLYEEGDAIEAGALLAVLDGRPFRDDVRQAKSEVAAQAATLAKLEAGSRPEEIAQARATVAEREATLVNARRLLERREQLVNSGAVSTAAYDDARAATEEAEARLRVAQEALDLALSGFREEDIAVARANLDSARARLAATETALADTELFAPADGIILARVREPGAIVSAGATVYTLSLTEPVWVQAYVAEPHLGRIHPGMPAEIITDTRPERPYRGQIGFISPVAEFTPKSVQTESLRTDLVYRLRVVVENPDKGLRQGMPVTVRLPEARTRDSAERE
ncbi:secretion protein HlyD [Rhodospirillaceae bacterium SYSU D60014]|uniref:secretion protein HlyD n=1 Tax=Virgifigura deserti TaxID=2268457 RepID=UPI000E66D5CC